MIEREQPTEPEALKESFHDKMVRQRREEDEKSKKYWQFLYDQKYIIVQVSARRYSIHRITSAASMGIRRDGKEFIRAILGAPEAEFGPATYEDCQTWLVINLEKPPQELLHSSLKDHS